MLGTEERQRVLEAIRFYGWLPRREIERIRDRADQELPYDLIARAVVEDPDPTVRWRAVDLLDHYADDRHSEAVVAATRDPVARVRQHAVHALGCTVCKRTLTGVDAVPALVACVLDEDNAKVRRHATWALIERLPDPRARDVLDRLAATDRDERVRGDAAAAIKHRNLTSPTEPNAIDPH
jgi:HEAT repeat protein